MSTSRTTIRRKNAAAQQRGSVAMIAIITMVVVFILALGLLTLGGNVRLSGKRQLARSGAKIMADAGVEYGYWQVRYKGASLPQTYGYNKTTNGVPMQFTVTATDNGASVAGTVKFVSTGAQGRETCTVTKVLPAAIVYHPFDYALCSNTALNGPDTTTGASAANGDIRANGNIYFSGATVVNGSATATGSISIPSTTGAKTPGGASLPFPAIDMTYYQSIANRSYNYSVSVPSSGFSFLVPNEVVYVNGDVTFNGGTISGTGIIVITGKLIFAGSMSYAFSDSKMAVLTGNGFSVAGGQLSEVGFYYTHNSSNNATAALSGKFRLAFGSMAADVFTFQTKPGDKPYAFAHDPSMSGALGSQMHLPGY